MPSIARPNRSISAAPATPIGSALNTISGTILRVKWLDCARCSSRCSTGHRSSNTYGKAPSTCARCSVIRKNEAMARNLSTTNPLEIHFGIGRDVHNLSPNFWLYTKGFIPPVGSWGEFDVDLTRSLEHAVELVRATLGAGQLPVTLGGDGHLVPHWTSIGSPDELRAALADPRKWRAFCISPATVMCRPRSLRSSILWKK